MVSKVIVTLLAVFSAVAIGGIGFWLHFSQHYSLLTDAPGVSAGSEVFVTPQPSYTQGMIVALQTADGQVHVGELGPQVTTGVVMVNSGTPGVHQTALRPSTVLGEVGLVIPNFGFIVMIAVVALAVVCLLTLWPAIMAWFPVLSNEQTVIVQITPAP